MIFRSDKHAEQWAEAIDRVGALCNQDDTVSAYFGASIYILTGMPFLYDRIKKHIHRDYIDFEAILDNGISSGERILVALPEIFTTDDFSIIIRRGTSFATLTQAW